MALATNTATGEIKLAGDLAGNNNANAPELTTVLSTPGTYVVPTQTVDAKGRITAIANSAPSAVAALIPDATASVKGVVNLGTNISVTNTAIAGYQTINFGGVLDANDLSGLCDNGATYSFKLLRDGAGPLKVEVAASDLTEIQDICNAVNAIITPFNLALVSGNLQISSNTTGVPSTVSITEDKLFQYMMNYVSIDPAVGGMGDATIYIPDATASVKGVAKFGAGLTVSGGSVSMNPIADATTSTKGIVQIGAGLSVTAGVVSTATVPDATTSVKGIVQIGSGINVAAGVISVDDATTSQKGVVQVGANLSVTAGVLTTAFGNATTSALGLVRIGSNINVSSGVISIPTATTSVLGLVQIGSGLSVTSGVVSAGTSPDATTGSKGIVQIGTGINVSSGVISVSDATTSVKGVISVGAGLSVSSGVLSAAAIPDATTSVKGLVQITSGGYLSVTAGVLSASIPDATTSVKGIVQIGTGLSVTAGVVSVVATPDATTSSKGLVQIGSGLTVSSGVVSATALPDATTSVKGLVQIGTGLSVTAGVVSASIPDATAGTPGLVTIGAGLSVTAGVVSVNAIPDASTSVKGLMQVGTGLSVTSGNVSTTLATNSVAGVVLSANTSNISISSGAIDVGANIPKLNAANTFTKAQAVALVSPTFGSTVTPDFSAGNVFSFTATSNFTLAAPTNVVAGGTYIIIIRQDGTGSRVATYNSAYKFGAGAISTLSTAANRYDIISIVAQGTTNLLTTTQIGFV